MSGLCESLDGTAAHTPGAIPAGGMHSLPSQLGTASKRKWRLLLPGASEPRLTELNPSGLQIGISNRLRGLSNRSIVVVCNYEMAR